MQLPPNPILKRLGYSDTDRLVILHADDVGMCQASLQAFSDLWDFGMLTSGAVMTPCPWFRAVAAYSRDHPQADLGVHATLTSEWDSYRWGPLSTRDLASGMLDDEGYFHRTSEAAQQYAEPTAVAAELDAQIERALAAGIQVTHVDTHMGTVAHPKFIPAYLQSALSRRIPPMIPRMDVPALQELGLEAEAAAQLAGMIEQLEAQGVPLLDSLTGMPLDDPHDQINVAKKLLGELPPGVTHFVLHPAVDTPELRAIAPDWPSRVANYQAFMSQELKDFILSSGLHLIGYRQLKALLAV